MAAHILRAERGPPRRPLTRAATCPYAHAQAHCPYLCVLPETNIYGSYYFTQADFSAGNGRKPVIIAHTLKLYQF